MTRDEYVAALKMELRYVEQTAAEASPEVSARRLADIDAELASFDPAPTQGKPGRASGRAPEIG